jgi:hypothetical protein
MQDCGSIFGTPPWPSEICMNFLNQGKQEYEVLPKNKIK